MNLNNRSRVAWALAVGLLLAAAATATTLEETFDQTYAFAPGDFLELDNTNGNVYIEIWDRSEIQIVATKKVKAGSSAKAESAMQDLRVEVEPSSGGIRVDTIYPRSSDRWFSGGSASVRYEIKIPSSADLDVTTTNGNIKVAGVSGDLDIGTTNGNVHVRDSGGRLNAHTTNGSISAELTQISAGEDMVFRTTNGGITLAIPPETQADLTARTTNGSIRTDFPITVQGTFSKNRLEGELNGGGGSIQLRTTNGSIEIEEL
jgi:DUF4097 and DUF4098 domain-containing protein YvlB